jgi:putative tryptophan/tyrosine transport system substrate-binding protein
MLNRRAFVCGSVTTVVAAPLTGGAQPQRVARIGILLLGSPSEPLLEVFRQGLRDLGYVEGRNISIEQRWADGRSERLPALAAELVRFPPDVIFAPVTQAALAAQRATGDIPIVVATAADPVGAGLVAGLAAPGGNVTGLSIFAPALVAKQLELLKEAVPKASRFAVLSNPGLRNTALMVKEAETAARSLGVAIQLLGVRDVDGFDGAFSAVATGGANGLLVLFDPFLFAQRRRMVEFASQKRLPAVYPHREYAEAGGLLAYGANVAENFRRAATYVDRILKGAKPGELPVEQPTRFELVINLKTVRALGLTIPPSLLLRADKVIE